jgi:hypothetical protein
MRSAGAASDDPTTLWNQFLMCDLVHFLDAAVDAAGALGPGLLRQGFERLGSSTPSALTWGTFFGPDEHTSASVLRDVAFDAGRGRYRYVSTVNHGDG